MCHIIQRNIKNRLLSLLPREDFQLLERHLERVDMPRLFVLSEPNEPSSFCYFIDAGIGSIVASSPAGKRAEIGIFGREGMSPKRLPLKLDLIPIPFSCRSVASAIGLKMMLCSNSLPEVSLSAPC
jgi:hypothetical protein